MFRHTSPAALALPGTAAPTVSAQEMARVTGVGRERLRTWERRHGFPEPVRQANNQRRYLATDVKRVVAAARAIEAGVPVADAIRSVTALHEAPAPSVTARIEAALEHCDAPALALAGPSSMRVAWANRPTLSAPESPELGAVFADAVPHFGAAALAQVHALMVDAAASSVVIEHRDWTTSLPCERRSLAWRLPPEAADEPTVLLLQLPQRAAAPMPMVDGDEAWAAALGCAREVLESGRGIASVQRSLGAFVRTLGGIDGFLATCQGPRLRTATSVTGDYEPRTHELEPGAPLSAAVHDGEVTWLPDPAARRLGVPERTCTLMLPLCAGGERIGAAFVLLPVQVELTGLVREFLHGFGTSLALALQREHAAQSAAVRERQAA